MNIDRSTKQKWLDGLGELYRAHLDDEDDAEALQLYLAERDAFSATYPDKTTVAPPPFSAEDLDHQAAIIQERDAAVKYAHDNPHDLKAQHYARLKTEQALVSVVGERQERLGTEVVRSGPDDTSQGHIEVIGEGGYSGPEVVS